MSTVIRGRCGSSRENVTCPSIIMGGGSCDSRRGNLISPSIIRGEIVAGNVTCHSIICVINICDWDT